MGCKLLLKQQPGWMRWSSPEPREPQFSSSLHIPLLPLFWGEMKQEVQRISVSIPLLFLLKSSWRQEACEQIFPSLETGNNRCHWWSGLSSTAESSRVTETQEGGKKRFWDRLLWAEKNHRTGPGDEFWHRTRARAREDEQHSKDIVGS